MDPAATGSAPDPSGATASEAAPDHDLERAEAAFARGDFLAARRWLERASASTDEPGSSDDTRLRARTLAHRLGRDRWIAIAGVSALVLFAAIFFHYLL